MLIRMLKTKTMPDLPNIWDIWKKIYKLINIIVGGARWLSG